MTGRALGWVTFVGLAACAAEEENATSDTSVVVETSDSGESGTETTTDTGAMDDCVPNDATPLMSPDYPACDASCTSCRTAPGDCGDVCAPPCDPCPAFPGFTPECVSFTQGESVCLLLCTDDDGCPGGMFCSAGHCYWPN